MMNRHGAVGETIAPVFRTISGGVSSLRRLRDGLLSGTPLLLPVYPDGRGVPAAMSEAEFCDPLAPEKDRSLKQGGGRYRGGTHNPFEAGSSPAPATMSRA